MRPRSARGQDHRAVVAQSEAGVVGDLPHVAVEVAEGAGVPAVERRRRRAADLGAVGPRLVDDPVDLRVGADVVRERDAAPAGAVVVADAHVGGQLVARPQDEDDAVGLEERGLLDVHRRRPPDRLVERLGAGVVGDAEGDEGDALLHGGEAMPRASAGLGRSGRAARVEHAPAPAPDDEARIRPPTPRRARLGAPRAGEATRRPRPKERRWPTQSPPAATSRPAPTSARTAATSSRWARRRPCRRVRPATTASTRPSAAATRRRTPTPTGSPSGPRRGGDGTAAPPNPAARNGHLRDSEAAARERIARTFPGRGFSPLLRPSVETGDWVQILQADPQLAAAVPAATREDAVVYTFAHAMWLERGAWQPPEAGGGGVGHRGLLVLDGFIPRHVRVIDRPPAELIGPGDLLHPWERDHTEPFPAETRYEVLEPARLAVLDRRFAAVAGRWPELVAALFGRAIARSRTMVLYLAISQLVGVEMRLLVLLWHIADRWCDDGEDGAGDGCVIPVHLTHQLLASLISAQRPTVTSALAQLTERGLISRTDNGRFVMHGGPPTEFRSLRAPVR